MMRFDNDWILKPGEFHYKEELKSKRTNIKIPTKNHSSIVVDSLHNHLISQLHFSSRHNPITHSTYIIQGHFYERSVITSVELQFGESVLHLGIPASIVTSLYIMRSCEVIWSDSTGGRNNMGFSIDNGREQTGLRIKLIDSLYPLLPDTITG
jgi:hypothetical protein